MKKLAIVLATAFAAVSIVPAAPPLSLTAVGTLQTGPLRGQDPRIAGRDGHGILDGLRWLGIDWAEGPEGGGLGPEKYAIDIRSVQAL